MALFSVLYKFTIANTIVKSTVFTHNLDILRLKGLAQHCTMLPFCNASYTDAPWRKRESQGRAKNVSRYGPLTDLPDYSYVDGRCVQLTTNQADRIEKRKQLTSRIVHLLSDLSRAQESHKLTQEKNSTERNKHLKLKLTPKLPSV